MVETLALFIGKDDPAGFVIAIIVGGGIIGLIAWGAHSQKKIRENWAMFARKNGLQMQGGKYRPTIQGWLGPVYITLNTVVRGSGKNRTTYTQYHVTINAPMPAGLAMYKEGFFSKVGKVLGGQDVQVGDAQLDAAFIIKGKDLLGIHNLLGLAPVKKALLYTIARHPGLRVQEKQLLVEHTGMSGNLNKIEGVFADLSYLAQTLDAGYQELVGSSQPQAAPPRPAPQPKSQTQVRHESQAAAAEILGAELFGKAVSPAPEVRRARPQDTVERKQALSEMAGALQQYTDKLASGEATPQPKPQDPAAYGASESSTASLDDAFADPDTSEAFANPTLNEEFSSAFESNAPESDKGESGFGSFDTASSDAAFKKAAAPVEQPTAKAAAGSMDDLIAKLSNSSLMSSDREKIVADHKGQSFEVELVIDRVDSSWGFDLPDSMRDGKTVEGKDKSGANFAVRFPKSRNDEIGKYSSGQTLKARGTLAAWDDLFKKATIDAV